MKKLPADPAILHLLVSIYNQSIQTYYYFPEVIICGRQRIDREEFNQLLEQDLVQPCGADSFGRYYRLSKKGEDLLLQSFIRRRPKQQNIYAYEGQHRLPFRETC